MRKTSVLVVASMIAVVNVAVSDEPFVRGDTNGDGVVDWVDAFNIVEWFFAEGPAPLCADAWDTDDDGELSIMDMVLIIEGECLGMGSIPPLMVRVMKNTVTCRINMKPDERSHKPSVFPAAYSKRDTGCARINETDPFMRSRRSARFDRIMAANRPKRTIVW